MAPLPDPATLRLWRRAFIEVPRLLALAFPLIAGLTVSTLMAVVDTVMLGPLGEVPLAVVSLTTSALTILYAVLYGFTNAVGILAGNAHGADAPHRVASVLHHGLATGVVAGVIGGAGMAAGMPLLDRLGQPTEVLAALPAYWLCLSAAMPAFTLAIVYKQIYDAIDRPWIAVLLMLTSVALNVPLNWVLIYGHLGFPALGVTGAGVASLVSTLFGLLVLALHWHFSPLVQIYRDPRALTGAGLKAQLREGVPIAIQYFLESSAFALAGLMVGWFGAVALAANQVVTAVTAVIFMAPLGMSAAVSIRIAQALGGARRDRAAAIGWAAIGVVALWMGGFTYFLVRHGTDVAALMVNDGDVIAVAGTLFTVVAVMQIADGVQSTSLGALRGLMDSRWPTVVTVLAYWGAALPASYGLGVAFDFGAAGIWAGFGIGLLVAATALTWRFHWLTGRGARPHP